MTSLDRSTSRKRTNRAVLPTTRSGWWALRLAGTSVVVLFAAPLLNLIPGFAPVTYSLALAAAVLGGVLALIAMIRDGERALTVYVALIPALFYAVFTVLEFFVRPEH